jgi:hypothetical protein
MCLLLLLLLLYNIIIQQIGRRDLSTKIKELFKQKPLNFLRLFCFYRGNWRKEETSYSATNFYKEIWYSIFHRKN